jgi:hypothetical protein
MIKQDWMVIVAGEALINALEVEQKAKCKWTGNGYASDDLCKLQRDQASRGIEGVEIVKSIYGYSVRYDSGLQNFGLLASSQGLGGTLEGATNYAKDWVAKEPSKRYAWMRKSNI